MTNINKLNLPDYETWKNDYLKSQRFTDLLKEIHSFENYELSGKGFFHPRVSSILDMNRIKVNSFIIQTDFTWTSYWFEYILSTVNSDELVLDIGCGENMFKKIYPEYNILGCNPVKHEHFGCDFLYQFTANDSEENKSLRDLYSNVGGMVAFNSAHFTSIDGVAKNCRTMVEALRPGGYVALSINSGVVLNNVMLDTGLLFRYTKKRKSYYANDLLDALTKCNEFDIVYFDTRFDTYEVFSNTGDIHIVLQKT